MLKRSLIILLLLIGLAACGSPVSEEEATAVAPSDATSLEGKTITFYHFGDLSGPYASTTGVLIHGFDDAIAAINQRGGIRGAQINVQFSDTGGSVDEAVAAYERFTSLDDNVPIMFIYGSGDAEALAGRFREDQIPALSAGLSAQAFYGPDSGYVFGYGPIYPDQFGLFLDYVKANWDSVKPAGAGDEIKLAYISWPGAYGQGALTPESRAYAESLGIEIVQEELIDLSPTADGTIAILNAQSAGANVIYTNTLTFGPATILNALASLDMRDQFLVGGNNWAMDVATFAFLSDPTFADGFIAPFPYQWWSDTDQPGIVYARDVFAANDRPENERSSGYLVSLSGVDLAVTAVEKAIDTVGFENLNGQAVYEALLSLGAYEAVDGVMHFDFSGSNRSPHTAQIRQIQGGPEAFVVLQDWTPTPDLRPEN
ncbi:MAG: ABC transporter substrate-binding protein [Anaerolineales bacterium]|nr:ABC transporter substrate-binding protein [Anaerolineales bacterium]MCB8991689.1 ABC transporter substrate-binding protein [Ardenticatenaceae bacterium]MCB9005547.1 ABC transporter substrate-binding protein [Ardenticatenaceae bacterium]